MANFPQRAEAQESTPQEKNILSQVRDLIWVPGYYKLYMENVSASER